RETEPALDGVIGRVLVEKPQKAGARANVGARHAKIRAVETALRGVRRIVAGVANPGHAKLGNQGGLVEQRNLVAGNLGVGDFYLAKSVAQKERVPGVELVGQLHGALVARFGEGVDVARSEERRVGEEWRYRGGKYVVRET